METDERELVGKCMAGDQDACTRLVEAYARMAGTVIWRATNNENGVEDLVQETFLRVFRALAYFDGRAKLSTWIYTIAHHVAIDHLRKAGRYLETQLAIMDDEAETGLHNLAQAGDLDPEAAFSRAETQRLVRAGLAKLPEKYRLPIVYSAIQGLDYPQSP